jgi:CDGSH-type Zn-finger protein
MRYEAKRADGTSAEVVLDCPGGPVLLRDAAEVVDDDGRRHRPTRPVVALCRCGRSGRAPWCDGTHKVFSAERDASLISEEIG